MRFVRVADRQYAQFERLAALPGLRHAFTCRPHDVSAREDAQAAARASRRARAVADFGFDPARLSYTVQVHRPILTVLEPQDAGRRVEDCDGLITTVPGLPMMTFSADCPLVLVFDPRRRAVGMAHASWRCTVGCMTERLIERMREELGCDPGDCFAGVGPSAGPNAYEVKDDVYEAARALPDRDALFIRNDGRMFFDLWEANRRQLHASGIPEANIEIAGCCTMTRTDIFYSFRREGVGCGHFGLLASLVNE